jgi:8-oxo-dGTP diphosphatase
MSFTYKYPRPALTVDAVVFDQEERVLLIRRASEPFKGSWAFPGGFVGENETLETAVYRELLEETSISDVDLQQFRAYSQPDRDPRHRTLTIVFVGQMKSKQKPLAGDDAENAGWFTLDGLPPLAFDHDSILKEVEKKFIKKQ